MTEVSEKRQQISKALHRSKTAFEKIQHRADLINDGVNTGREIYEIEKALECLNDLVVKQPES